MAKVLSVIGWLLLGAAALVLVAPMVLPGMQFDLMVNGLPAGVLIALGGQLFAQSKTIVELREKRSRFYLDSTVLAFEEARTLLADGNNERATWVAAGRALRHAEALSLDVIDGAHIRVLELHKLKYRGTFGEILAAQSAAFYYGAVNTQAPIDGAAAQSTAREQRAGRTITSTLRELPEQAIRAVWQAAQWPVDFKDPLEGRFSAEERAKLLVLYPGLHEFLEHRDRWHSASGRLFLRNPIDTDSRRD